MTMGSENNGFVRNQKPLAGTQDLLPAELVDQLNAHIEAAVTQLVKHIPGHARKEIAPVIGKLSAAVLATYRNHAALHGL